MVRRRTAGRPLQVLAVTSGAELYGSDRVFLESVSGLQASGHSVSVATGADGPLVATLRRRDVSVSILHFPVLRRTLLTPAGLARFAGEMTVAIPRLVRRLRRSGVDVLYVNTATLPVWLIAARIAGCRSVVHVHEAESHLPHIVRTGLDASLLMADRLVFNSRTSLDLATRTLGRALPAHEVILNPVTFDDAPTAPRADLTEPVRLVFVGRLSARKGIDIALDAVATLRARGRHVVFDALGDVFRGNEAFGRRLSERSDRPDLLGHIRFRGFVPRPARSVAEADVVLVPSSGPESFGNVLVEAVGAARPVVATSQDGLIEAAQDLDGVRFVSPGDAVALADGVEDTITGWGAARDAALRDAQTVRRRHDPAAYGRRVAAAIEAAATTARATSSMATASVASAGRPLTDVVGDSRVLVVSPHLDDAVLSAWALLTATGDRADVLTACDGAPEPPARTGWDRLSGFRDSDDAMSRRHAENDAAFAGLPHRQQSVELLDAQYLSSPRGRDERDRLSRAVLAWAEQAGPGPKLVAVPAGAGIRVPAANPATDQAALGRRAGRARIRRLVGPVGRALLDVRARVVARHSRPVQHEDHVWVRDVVLSSLPPDTRVLLYEDLPYAWGATADEEVSALNRTAMLLEAPIDTAVKSRHVGRYTSQLQYMYSPYGSLSTPQGLPDVERYWLIDPSPPGA